MATAWTKPLPWTSSPGPRMWRRYVCCENMGNKGNTRNKPQDTVD